MFHRRESALYRPGLREQAAGFDGIRSISRLCGKTPSCERKFRGATGKRAFHEIEAGKNHAADESSVAPQDIHRGCSARGDHEARPAENRPGADQRGPAVRPDRKSTRLNSSHVSISYAVFCLKKKKKH